MMLLQLRTVQRDMCYMKLLLLQNTDQRYRIYMYLTKLLLLFLRKFQRHMDYSLFVLQVKMFPRDN